jgi:hypothetical protein
MTPPKQTVDAADVTMGEAEDVPELDEGLLHE